MDAAGIDMQVLSLNYPGVEQLEAVEAISAAREANDFLTEAVKNNPMRFAGLAALPTAAPDKAAGELDRMAVSRALKAQSSTATVVAAVWMTNSLAHFGMCRVAKCSDYLHPTMPQKSIIEALYGGFSPITTFLFAGPAWGWHIETAVHVVRIILGGVFDRYPKLQIVIGHLGEGLPFMLPRLHNNLPMEATKLSRPISAYLRENVHYTFGSFNFQRPSWTCCLKWASRIMFSADYP